MQFFKQIIEALLGTGNKEIPNMTELHEIAELENALTQHDTLILFKHSTTCPVSASALSRIQPLLDSAQDLPPIYLIKVIQSRPLSNHIATSFNVTHQSPQALVIQNGTSIWNGSHGAITSEAITQALNT